MNGILETIISALLNLTQFTHEVDKPMGIGCDLRINRGISHKQPLFLKEIQGNEKGYAFDEPDVQDEMLFESGESVLLACPGSGFHYSNNTVLRVNCVQMREFRDENNNEERPFEEFECNRLPESKLKREGQCADNKSAFAIGFEVREAFVKIIDLCFDEDTSSALYAIHKLKPNITGSQRDGYRMSFKEGGLFSSISANVAYNRNHQIHMFSKIISKSAANVYINNLEFFARGHLAPRADFIFDSQQAATFYYANAGPQWQTFNSGNWEKLEAAIRRFVIKKQLELTVYTGTYGTFEINGKKMFLTYDSAGQYKIPIPQIFWKVLYDEKNERAVAFVGLNDPYGNPSDNPAKKMCSEDICHLISWVSFQPNPRNGLMYCCEFYDFVRAMETFPPIGYVDGVLVG